MSNTIQPRMYTASQAALLQQRPGELIEAAEHMMNAALEASQARTVHVLYQRAEPQLSAVGVVGVGSTGQGFVKALTAGTKFAPLTLSWPTSPEMLVELDEFQTDNWSRWAGLAKEALQKAAPKEERSSTAAARLRVERLAVLQAVFGFTTQDLAAVLGITRQQLYKWLNDANEVKLQEASRARLAAVERTAKEWRSRSAAPLSSVSHETLANGGTVFAMLTADAITEAEMVAAFDELVAKLQTKPKTRSQRLSEAGFTRRASARSLPSDE